MTNYKNKIAGDVISAMEHRLASLIMILGQMVLSALRINTKECTKKDIDAIMNNVSEVQSEICIILQIPKDTLVDAMITVNKMLSPKKEEKLTDDFIDNLKSIVLSPGGKS